MNRKQAEQLIRDFLDECYQNSEPATSWDKIKGDYAGKEEPFYDYHPIDEQALERIYLKYQKKMGKMYENDLAMAYLNWAPTTLQAIEYREKKK